MASSPSINTSSLLKTQPLLPNPKSLKTTIHKTLKPSNPIHKQKPLSLNSTLKPTSRSHIPTNHFDLYPHHSQLPIPQKPTSTISPLVKISTFCAEKIVVFLIGSFLFMGFLGTRPVVAVPAEKSSYSEKMEGKRETQDGKVEDEEMYVKLVEEDPRNVEAVKMVFQEKIRRGKSKEGLEYVKRLVDLQPGEVEWRLLEALCYEMMGELSEAKKLFECILAERPLLVRALHGLAMVMHKNREGPAVFEMLNKALEVACHEKRVTEERNIRILIAQMHVVKVIAWTILLFNLDFSNLGSYLVLKGKGLSIGNLGELEEGLRKLQVLVDENPRDFRPYLCQGLVYSLLNKKEEAKKQFDIYRSLVPEEFPQKGFLDDVVLEAITSSRQQLEKELQS
ncbi:hypothetical protein RHMOL_Rhmol10G0221000 [Rhododendron molle]|uniref:Uncharacterized protein n=1 Tax=Rhododendron molle TaxID=49168 RepID=A0ACC0M6G4_RHOML|nr:hypothetical protein RHMOL_Rhmol10G0221000 [Rhododendron molle]